MDRILFLTGRLAKDSLETTLRSIDPPASSWEIYEIGLQVAGLMTADMIERRLAPARYAGFDKIIVPGRCRGDLKILGEKLKISILRGPDELKDIPNFFNRRGKRIEMDKYDIQIFAEITDATKLTTEEILERAKEFERSGADVIDLGCLPDTEFPHLEASIAKLKKHGLKVSVDSLNPGELERGAIAQADYLLSLVPENLWIAEKYRKSIPIIIPDNTVGIDSLYKSIRHLKRMGIDFMADSILDPIPFGFTDSVVRFSKLRSMFPEIKILVGTGNLTELIDADTMGINAILLGICSEIRASAVLTTQVSDHAKSVIKEIDISRRVMFASRENQVLPKNLTNSMLAIHEKKPFPDSLEEIKITAQNVKDPNFRIQITSDGLHVYNRDGLRSGQDPFQFYEKLGVEEDSSHAFYLGVELARAEIAWSLGKRYAQDRGLDWGAAAEPRREDALTHCQPKIKKKIRNRKNTSK